MNMHRHCETHFGERKHRLASKYGCPIRADKFVRIEISDHEGSAKLFASKLMESSDIMCTENWRNKVKIFKATLDGKLLNIKC